jgi:hypothetical protein
MIHRSEITLLLISVVGLLRPVIAHADMHLLHQEMFATPVNLTQANPGSQFSSVVGILHQRVGGPKLSGGTPSSADLRGEGVPAYGRIVLQQPQPTKVFIGAWFHIKEVSSGEVDLMSINDPFGNPSPTISIRNGALGGGIKYNSFQANGLSYLNRWIFVGMAIRHKGGTTADVRFYHRLPGQPLFEFSALNNVNVGIGTVGQAVMGATSTNLLLRARLGAPSVYRFDQDDFSDVAYPIEILEPDGPRTWYCNPLTGNDTNSGESPATAWKTVTKLNQETFFNGMLAASGHAVGDTLIIDTSGAPLELPGVSLDLRTPGLNLRAAQGQEWIKFKGCKTITANSWQTTTTQNVYSTTDTQLGIVPWEDDRWLHHAKGLTFASVATELSQTPGSFWTDGTTLYIHPLGSTNPRSDGKRYERSYRFDQISSILLGAPNMNIRDIHAGKTCTAEKSTNEPIGANCLVLTAPPLNMIIRHCFLYYGDKHNLSLVAGDVGDDLLVDDVQCEQGSPYAGPGGQTLYVSYNHKPQDLNIIHRFHNCRSIANAGKIGHTEGVMTTVYPVYLSHNQGALGEPDQFALFEFKNCDFGHGNIQGSAAKNVIIRDTRCGSCFLNSDVFAERSHFSDTNYINPGHSLTERNCVHIINGVDGELRSHPVAGTIDIQGCTFDARTLTGIQGGVPQAALFNRTAALSLTFKNNLVWLPTANVLANVFANLDHTDSFDLSNNAYFLGGNRLVYLYNDGVTLQNKNLAQWQALGHDAASQNLLTLTLNGLQPLTSSPLVDAGINMGPLDDFTGNVFRVRNDIGAYEAPPIRFSSWQAEHFTPTQLLNPQISGANATPMNDGVPNLIKYGVGLGAWEAAPLLTTPTLPNYNAPAPRLWDLLYQRNTWATDLQYSLRYSADLSIWSNAVVTQQQIISTTEGVQTIQATIECPPGDSGFARLQLTLLP